MDKVLHLCSKVANPNKKQDKKIKIHYSTRGGALLEGHAMHEEDVRAGVPEEPMLGKDFKVSSKRTSNYIDMSLSIGQLQKEIFTIFIPQVHHALLEAN